MTETIVSVCESETFSMGNQVLILVSHQIIMSEKQCKIVPAHAVYIKEDSTESLTFELEFEVLVRWL